jgi:hypothetical protein
MIAGPTILVLIQTCLLDTMFDYDKVFQGPSGPGGSPPPAR